MATFIDEHQSVEICELQNEKLQRNFYILKMSDKDLFLASCVGSCLRKNWTPYFSKAAVWPDVNLIVTFCQQKGFVLPEIWL